MRVLFIICSLIGISVAVKPQDGGSMRVPELDQSATNADGTRESRADAYDGKIEEIQLVRSGGEMKQVKKLRPLLIKPEILMQIQGDN